MSSESRTALGGGGTYLRVLVLAVTFQMLSDRDCLFDEVVKILGELGGQA